MSVKPGGHKPQPQIALFFTKTTGAIEEFLASCPQTGRRRGDEIEQFTVGSGVQVLRKTLRRACIFGVLQ